MNINEIRLRHDNHTDPTQAEREILLDQIRSYELNLGLSMKTVEELEVSVAYWRGNYEQSEKDIKELEAELADVSRLESAFVRIAKAIGVTSPLVLIAHAENDQENYAEVLARYIEKRETTLNKEKS